MDVPGVNYSFIKKKSTVGDSQHATIQAVNMSLETADQKKLSIKKQAAISQVAISTHVACTSEEISVSMATK